MVKIRFVLYLYTIEAAVGRETVDDLVLTRTFQTGARHRGDYIIYLTLVSLFTHFSSHHYPELYSCIYTLLHSLSIQLTVTTIVIGMLVVASRYQIIKIPTDHTAHVLIQIKQVFIFIYYV